jgi:glycosyltransferase involved in cell wall biosynthesis
MATGIAPEVTFVIPVYNEPDSIEATLRALREYVRAEHDVLVVHDFDEDTTVPVVRALGSEMPEVQLLRNDLGRGVLNAMKMGIAAATAPYVIVSMADGSDDYRDVDAMLALARGGADVVAGSRYMKGGRQIGGPRLKSLMSRGAGLSLHFLGGVATHDATNNFKLYSSDLLDTVTIESEGGFELALELTVKATLDGRTVAEVPTTWRDRSAGESNFKMRAWLPRYLRWYGALFAGRIRRLLART